jgi:Ca2+-binding EF-hand superfamily protein
MRIKLFVLTAVVVSLSFILASGNAFTRNDFGGWNHGHPNMKFGFDRMQKLDANEDGVISLQEFTDARLTRGDTLFDRLDQDNDGVISAEEYADRPGKGFIGRRESLKLDQEAFNKCMKDQLGGSYQERSTWEELFAATDTNSDNFIDRKEFLAQKEANVAERFAQIDINNDGNLDPGEFDIVNAQMQEHHQARRSCYLEQRELNHILSTQ